VTSVPSSVAHKTPSHYMTLSQDSASRWRSQRLEMWNHKGTLFFRLRPWSTCKTSPVKWV